MNATELRTRLQQAGQEHALRWWDELNAAQRSALAASLASIDFEGLRRQWESARSGESGGDSPAERARRARPPANVVRLPSTDAERAAWAEATRLGNAELAAGRVGAIVVAGGEGTRLQFPHPKGMYPIGPVTDRTLFPWLAEQILERSRRADRPIPCYIMTSDSTHAETVAHFAERRFFGLPERDVTFFRQGTMPVVAWDDGRLLMASKHEFAASPDGHGGLLAALVRERLLHDMAFRGIDHLFYMQVDNPTVIACDPAFLGLHVGRGSELSTKVVAKRTPEEKLGVVCEVDGLTQIVEYSDLPADIASFAGPNGRLVHWAGNTAIHVFHRAFLERLAADAESLPFHAARKHVPYLDDAARLVQPRPPDDPPNACKLERFIFDALPLAKTALVVEADREREFNPLKDRVGDNSPEAVRAALSSLGAAWLRRAGIDPPDGTAVEVAPLAALEEDDLARLGADEVRGRIRRTSGGWVVDAPR